MSSQIERMLEQFAKLERRSLEIESLLSRPEIASDNLEYKRLSKERGGLEAAIALFRAHKKATAELEGLDALLGGSDPELAAMAREERDALLAQLQDLEKSLALELIPKDPNDGRNIILEVRAGAGGDEASLFAMQLFRMYGRYCERQRWKVEVLSVNETELGGVKEAIALVSGDDVYRALKYESGVHRVQRVPATEAQGRVHTSTVTVAVLPEADDVEVNINENDLRIDTYRASGAGGQHVNRTDSAVRITHIPSGIVVACQDERSQIKNRARALKVLQAKLLEQAQIEQDRALSEERRSQVGRGDRSERIRTYNFPQSRVTDHRINRTIHSIGAFMEGDIGEMVEALKAHDQTEALKALSLA